MDPAQVLNGFRERLVWRVVRLAVRASGLDDLDRDELDAEVRNLMARVPGGFDAELIAQAVRKHAETYEEDLMAALVGKAAEGLFRVRDSQLPHWRGSTLRFPTYGDVTRNALKALGRILDVRRGALPSRARDVLMTERIDPDWATSRAPYTLGGGCRLSVCEAGWSALTLVSEDQAKAVQLLLIAHGQMRAAGYPAARRGAVLLRGSEAIEAELAAIALPARGERERR